MMSVLAFWCPGSGHLVSVVGVDGRKLAGEGGCFLPDFIGLGVDDLLHNATFRNLETVTNIDEDFMALYSFISSLFHGLSFNLKGLVGDVFDGDLILGYDGFSFLDIQGV